jgi:glyoxylase-like metal-dependent hydrolase (beta-lactamase superfamily II)
MQLGNLDVASIIDGSALFPKDTFGWAAVTDQQWAEHDEFLVDDHVRIDCGGFLVRSGGRVALVDLGIGSFDLPPLAGGELLANLAAQGVAPEDVTDVIFTHLHDDHVGWASTLEGAPTFPNATYRCHQLDWDHIVVGDGDMTGNATNVLSPLANRFEMWSRDTTLLPGIDTLHAPGHTPGSTILVLSSGAERAMVLGDVVHCPVQLIEAEWAAFFDVDPSEAQKTRERVIREVEGADVAVAACHFPGLRFGRLLQGAAQRSWSLVPAQD